MNNTNTLFLYKSFVGREGCPNCGSDKIMYLDNTVNAGHRVNIEYSCMCCDYEWDEIYVFSHSELPEDDGENDE